AVGRPEDLRDRFRGTILEVLADRRFDAKNVLAGVQYVTSVNLFGDGLYVATDDGDFESAATPGRCALGGKGIQGPSGTKVAPSIEDVFFQLTEKDGI